MIWGNSYPIKTLNRGSHVFLSLIVGLLLATPALAQFPVTINSTTTTGTASININEPQILSIRIHANDADYPDEGFLTVNGDTTNRISLFGSRDTGNDMVTSYITLDSLSQAQLNAFNLNGANTLDFEYNSASMDFDTATTTGPGFVVYGIEVISQLPKKVYSPVDHDVDASISPERDRALSIYKRLVGVRAPVDHPTIIAMEQEIAAGDLAGAAALATDEPGFYNLVVRDFAARMSTRDESINAPFSDFVATVIGVTRDEIDARKLLNGNFFYRGSIDATVDSNVAQDIVRTGDHYTQLADQNYDFSAVLTRENAQYLRVDNDNVRIHPDSAGVLTSRAFMGAHAIAGTNRRLVEFTMRQFACFSMEEWADANAPDIRVGRDIDRFPGGEGSKFLTTCKACHSVMDGFRGAFAKYNFNAGNGGFVEYRAGVDPKMNRDDNVNFAQGYVTTDNSWINNARSPANQQRFGWRGVVSSGSGVRTFGTAVANSRAFSECMTKRVYRELCRRPVSDYEDAMIEQVSSSFEASGYNLRTLFEEVSVRPECLGVN